MKIVAADLMEHVQWNIFIPFGSKTHFRRYIITTKILTITNDVSPKCLALKMSTEFQKSLLKLCSKLKQKQLIIFESILILDLGVLILLY